jgi:hypothetical protein
MFKLKQTLVQQISSMLLVQIRSKSDLEYKVCVLCAPSFIVSAIGVKYAPS